LLNTLCHLEPAIVGVQLALTFMKCLIHQSENTLTPIIYTVGALLAKQMSGELCFPKEASLLASAPDYSVFIMGNVLSHSEIDLSRLLVTPQAEYVLLFSL